jgi:hypothetical protein
MTISKSDRIAICGELFPGSLKQRLLFFDRIGVLGLEDTMALLSELNVGNLNNELDFLQTKDIVFDAGPYFTKYLEPYQTPWDNKHLLDDLERLDDITKIAFLEEGLADRRRERTYAHSLEAHIAEFLEVKDAQRRSLARFCARSMQQIDGLESSAVFSEPSQRLDNMKSVSGAPQPSTNVIDVVLDKLPMPSEQTPWEAILDFKADEEAQGYLQGLKVWMADITRQKLTANEASEKLDWLVFQHKKHLEMHKLSCRWGTLGGTFVAAAEILEDLAKIKWGKAAGAIVSIFDKRVELMKAELSNPAKEVSYIVKAQEQFGE